MEVVAKTQVTPGYRSELLESSRNPRQVSYLCKKYQPSGDRSSSSSSHDMNSVLLALYTYYEVVISS